MATYVGFLRAINLGATRKFPKAAIITAVEAAGFGDVETYINTGNVRFTTPMRSHVRIEEALEESFAEAAGFDVPTIVFTAKELTAIAEEAAGFGHAGGHYVSLLKETPPAAAVARLESVAAAGEVVRVRGRAVHLLLDGPYGTSRLSNAAVERQLGVATNRNLTVIRTLAEKWGS